MATSLSNTESIDSYLLNKLDPAERLVVEARILTDPNFARRVESQQTIHGIARYFGRRKLRRQLESIHQALRTNPMKQSFRRSITQLFETK